jgi:glycosyltransferase involved in cell wall biosynthesis
MRALGPLSATRRVRGAGVKRSVLIIVENAPVPLDPRVWKEALALRDAGYRVAVLSPRMGALRKPYELNEGIHIYRHPMPECGSGVAGYLKEYGCAFFWQVIYSWKIYLQKRFNVIQACNPPDDILLACLPLRVLGVKFIFDHHDVNPELYVAKYGRKGVVYRILAVLEKLTFAVSDVVISTNDSYREVALTRGRMPPDRVFVVRNGPDLSKFKPVAPNEKLKHGKAHLIGYVGVMGEQDGLDILLSVAEEVKRRGRTDIHFTCIGSGPAFPQLQQMVKDKNIGDIVNFTGRVSDEDVLEILSTADVCVNPDKPCKMNDMSTMIKIMEYMALGKPIVQFDLKEGRVSAQGASLYCDCKRPIDDFADKILWLLDHPEDRARMGELGRERVGSQLAWDYSVEHLLAAYERAFDNDRAGRFNPADATGQ